MKGVQAFVDTLALNAIGDLTDASGSDCVTWILADSGNLSLNFKVHYTDIRVNSIRYSENGSVASVVGSDLDLAGEKNGYLMKLDAPFTNFYGFFGYQGEDGNLSGFGSISYNRKDFDDNLLFLEETNKSMADAKARLKVLEAAIDNEAVAQDGVVPDKKNILDQADQTLSNASLDLTQAESDMK